MRVCIYIYIYIYIRECVCVHISWQYFLISLFFEFDVLVLYTKICKNCPKFIMSLNVLISIRIKNIRLYIIFFLTITNGLKVHKISLIQYLHQILIKGDLIKMFNGLNLLSIIKECLHEKLLYVQ